MPVTPPTELPGSGDEEPAPGRPRAVLSVDLEEWFHICGVPELEDPAGWEALPSRVEGDTWRLLRLLEGSGARATFFVLGWVAERHPDLVRQIAAAGHEIASHGYSHRPLHLLDPATFRREIAGGRDLLQDLTGQPVVGFRAPEWSLTRETFWAIDILQDEGYLYDSSGVPLTGMGDRVFLPGPHRIRTERGSLLEIPPSTYRLFWERIPFSGGTALRFTPAWVALAEMQRSLDREGIAVAYLHPWELDPDPPRIRLPWIRRVMHYTGLAGARRKLELFLERFAFAPFVEVLGIGSPSGPGVVGCRGAEEPAADARRRAVV